MLTNNRIGAFLLLIFCVAYGVLTFRITLLPFQAKAAFTARTMPEALAVLGVALSLLLLLKPGSDAKPEVSGFLWKRAAMVCVLMVLYSLTIRAGGFLISTSLFLSGGFIILGERRPLLIVLSAVPIVVAFWFLISQFLGVYVAPWPEFLTAV
jgi:putative tricarboxylic transport membrane protein